MKTIKEVQTYSEIIKKSKFITFLHPITSLNEIKEILEKYKKEYADATHICYSYILDENTYKYYDDGEPNQSAGLPIYQVLKNNQLVYILCVVIRYFGGIKLGTGGLSHAYSEGVNTLLKTTPLIEYKKTDSYIIEIPYSLFDSLNYYLEKKGIVINNKQFLDTVLLMVNLDQEQLEQIKTNFNNLEITLMK